MNLIAKWRAAAPLGVAMLCLSLGLVVPESAEAAQACRRVSVDGANQPVNPSSINQGLFNQAILAEVNYLRCRKGLPRLSPVPGLRRVAEGHARWMARARNLTHNSSVRGRRTPSERIIGTGIDIRMGSENIAKVSLYRIDSIGQFRIGNGGKCQFASADGQRIGRHTYASLASHIATLWYRSSGHRKNMMDRRARFAGTGAGFDAQARYCGEIYVSQALAG